MTKEYIEMIIILWAIGGFVNAFFIQFPWMLIYLHDRKKKKKYKSMCK